MTTLPALQGNNAFAAQENGPLATPILDRATVITKFFKAAVLAGNIVGNYFDKISHGPFAGPTLPDAWRVTLGNIIDQRGAFPQPNPPVAFPQPNPPRTPIVQPTQTWTAKVNGSTADVDLGNGYTLQVNEHNSELTIVNQQTGEKTRIWGDPHVEIDGKQAYDFWGTTTFTLEDGTKITVNTEPWNGNPNAYVASSVAVTKGDQALVIEGISQNQIGDLSVSLSNNGRQIDAQNQDGFVLHENAEGAGWLSAKTGKVATQADLDATRVGAEYGPGTSHPDGPTRSLNELAPLLSSYFQAAVQLGRLADRVDDVVARRIDRAFPNIGNF
ncbi:MAG: DUF1521 domain-containing protein [Sphingomonas sp.]